MNAKRETLRHLAYFEVLAAMQEMDAEWRSTTAGLVVLRLLDAWLEEGAGLVADDSWSLRAAREEVEEISVGDPIRLILGGVLDGMKDAPKPTMTTIAPRLMAYGRALNHKASWGLAADVYTTVIEHARPTEDAEVVIDAHMRLGYCLRLQGEYGPALEAYAEAGRLASDTGDLSKMLRARIGDAKVAIDRGNLPQAEAILEETIRRAESERLREVRAIALHDRADVAHRRGDYERAVCFAFEALDDVQEPVLRDRVLADIAASFFELGIRTAARDAHLILATTAQEQYSRWVATLNLLEIAAFDECEPVFEQYRRELASASLPPMLETVFHLYVGRGQRVFGHVAAARNALRRALELATTHRFNQIVFDAEQSLSELEQGVAVAVKPPAEVPAGVQPVVSAIHSMREMAGLSK